MGLNLKRDMRRSVPINFTRDEMSYYMKHFRQMDVENKGFLTLSDLKRHFQVRESSKNEIKQINPNSRNKERKFGVNILSCT